MDRAASQVGNYGLKSPAHTPLNPVIEEALTEWLQETGVPEKGFR